MDLGKVGKFICRVRKEQNLTQNQLGDMLGVSGKAISKWERGISAPDISMLKELCTALHITVQELLAGEKANEQKATEEEVEDLTISTIGTYNKLFKDKYKKVIIALSILLVALLIIFSAIYFVNNYNKCFVYEVTSENDQFHLEGLIANNQKESSLLIAGLRYDDPNVGTDEELLVNRLEAILKVNKKNLYNQDYIFENISIEKVIENICITVSESPELDKILKNKRKIETMEIVLKYRTPENKFGKIIIPIKVVKRFSNNKIIY